MLEIKKPFLPIVKPDEINVQLIAAADTETDSRRRIHNVHALVTEMILLGSKKNRTKKIEEKVSDAA